MHFSSSFGIQVCSQVLKTVLLCSTGLSPSYSYTFSGYQASPQFSLASSTLTEFDSHQVGFASKQFSGRLHQPLPLLRQKGKGNSFVPNLPATPTASAALSSSSWLFLLQVCLLQSFPWHFTHPNATTHMSLLPRQKVHSQAAQLTAETWHAPNSMHILNEAGILNL